MRAVARFVPLIAAAVALPVPAQAQNSGVDGVLERERLNNPVDGVRLGSIVIYPAFSAGAQYDDNLFAQAENPRDDLAFVFAGEVAARAPLGPVNLSGRIYGERSFHATYPSEDIPRFGISTQARYDLGSRGAFSISLSADRDAEDRGSLSSFNLTAEPVRYTSYAALGVYRRDLGRLNLVLSARARRLNYSDAIVAGDRETQDFRDLAIGEAGAAVALRISPITRITLRGSIERRIYDLRRGDPGFDPITSLDRSTTGVRFEIGFEREINALILAALRVGYLNYHYPDPALRDVGGFSYAAELRWNPTGLTTVVASAERRLDETTSPLFAGLLRDEMKLEVQHELLRRLILIADGRYARIAANQSGIKTHEIEFGFTARYYLWRGIQLEARLRHRGRSSGNDLFDYSANRILLGVRFAL